MLSEQAVLVTGGTGSFGRAFVRRVLELGCERVVVFSRDELKQHEQRLELPDERVRWFLGDVRDVTRLRRAMAGIDVVVHAAALKQVEACEYNPIEAVATNVLGARNVIEAALDCGVSRVIALGTDKAVDPVNLYGATKLVAEKLFVDANVYSGAGGSRFSATRYGNVVSSRGSVLPVFSDAFSRGDPFPVTRTGMTRFVLTIDRAVEFVVECLGRMSGGEVFVPRLPAVDLMTIARAVSWPAEPRVDVVGRRPGEKMHELLVSAEEAYRARVFADRFEIHRLDQGGGREAFSSEFAERLDVAGFRALAGLGPTLEEAAS